MRAAEAQNVSFRILFCSVEHGYIDYSARAGGDVYAPPKIIFNFFGGQTCRAAAGLEQGVPYAPRASLRHGVLPRFQLILPTKNLHRMELTTQQTTTKANIVKHLIAEKEASLANMMELQQRDQGEATEEMEEEHNLYENGKVDQALNRVEARASILDALKEDIAILKGIDTIEPTEEIQLGDVIDTNHGKFFVAVAADEFEVDGVKYRGISTKSPLFRALLGKHNGDSVEVGEASYTLNSSY